MGLKFSFLKTNIFCLILVSIVGSKSKEFGLCNFPPISIFAPLSSASWIWFSTFSRACLDMRGPISQSFKPEPILIFFNLFLSFIKKSSWISLLRKILLADIHVWPAFLNFAFIKPSIAKSILASEKTIKGAFPPSSNEMFLIVFANISYPFALLSFPTKVIQFFFLLIIDKLFFFADWKKTANLLLLTNLFSKPSRNLFFDQLLLKIIL